MWRKIQEQLEQWVGEPQRKPLIIKGARQVGKTFVLKDWGKQRFARVHYINFEKSTEFAGVFAKNFDVQRIISELGLLLGTQIDVSSDLIIFDEIQACERALSSLKYFCEDMPQLALCNAGSLLGVILSDGSFPVGKVTFLHMHPMDFGEFVRAVAGEQSWQLIPTPSLTADVSPAAHQRLWDLLKIYFVTGGMPEVVAAYTEQQRDWAQAAEKIRVLQDAIIQSYMQDFSKHAGPLNAVHIQSLYRSIPAQLQLTHEHSTKRFQFNDVMAGKKGFAQWERPMHWLVNADLAIQVKIANAAEQPLEHFTKTNKFKLFLNDVGLLGCALNLPVAGILTQNYGTAKGFFAENFVAQEMRAALATRLHPLYAWQEGTAQIEFVRHYDHAVMPIEVKAGTRTKAKSLAQFRKKYQPPLSLKISAEELHYDETAQLLHLPLYLSAWAARLASVS